MCRMNYKCNKEEEQFLHIFKKFVVEVGRKISFFWGEGKKERDYDLRVTKTHPRHNNHHEHFKRLSLLTTLYQLIPLLGFHRSDRLWRRSD